MRFVAMVAHGERAAWTVEAKDIDEARALVERRLAELPQPYRDASMICTELRAVEEQLGGLDDLLRRVHARLRSSEGVAMLTRDGGSVQARWRRWYESHGLSDLRVLEVHCGDSIRAVLEGVLRWEDAADARGDGPRVEGGPDDRGAPCGQCGWPTDNKPLCEDCGSSARDE